MNIATKTGDAGYTQLYKGGRVPKDHLRIEMCGLIDEVSSFLGLAKSLCKAKKIKRLLSEIQHDLYLIAAEIATLSSKTTTLKKRVNAASSQKLDRYIVGQEKKTQPRQRGFVFAGETPLASIFDVCRSITRRLERRIVTAKRKKMITNRDILVYLNRLSDVLYLLARAS